MKLSTGTISFICMLCVTACTAKSVPSLIPQKICPSGMPMVNCFVLPCLTASCPARPNATCTDGFCGGCNAVFHDSNGVELSEADCTSVCPDPDKPWHFCFIRPCLTASCPAHPDAVCEDNYCGGCNAVFIKNNQKLSKEECNPPAACPPHLPLHYCTKRPCQTAACPGYPKATCTDDYCGGCNAVFSDEDGNVLSEDDCLPPPVQCPPLASEDELFLNNCSNDYNAGSTCSLSCPSGLELFNVHSVTCLDNGRWDRTLAYTECQAKCPPGIGNVKCKLSAHPCANAECPFFPDALPTFVEAAGTDFTKMGASYQQPSVFNKRDKKYDKVVDKLFVRLNRKIQEEKQKTSRKKQHLNYMKS